MLFSFPFFYFEFVQIESAFGNSSLFWWYNLTYQWEKKRKENGDK